MGSPHPQLDEELLDAARLYTDTAQFLAAAFAQGLGHIVQPTCAAQTPFPEPRSSVSPVGLHDTTGRVLSPTASKVLNQPMSACASSTTSSPTSDVTVRFPAPPLIIFDLDEALASKKFRGDEDEDTLSRCFGGARRLAMLDAALTGLSNAGASLAICSVKDQLLVESALTKASINLLRHFDATVCYDENKGEDKFELVRRAILEPRAQPARSVCIVDGRPATLKQAARRLPGCKTFHARTGGIGQAECRELVEWVSEMNRNVYRSDFTDRDAEACWHAPSWSHCCSESLLVGDITGIVLSRSSPSWEFA